MTLLTRKTATPLGKAFPADKRVKRAVVHIGMPKTGSTSIQKWLEQNKAVLAQRGVGYDQINPDGFRKDGTHHGIALVQRQAHGELMPNKTFRLRYGVTDLEKQSAFAQAFEAELERAVLACTGDTFVLSSEALAGLAHSPEQIKSLQSWLSRYFEEAHYVVYFRRQEDWLVSSYSQRLRRGSTKPFEDFLAEDGRQNWFAVARKWADHVGRDNLSVRLLDRDRLKDGDLIADFADILGISRDGTEMVPSTNESLSAAAAEYLRVTNLVVPATSKNGKKLNPLRQKVRAALDRQDLGLPKLALSPKDAKRLRKINAVSNEKLRAMFFPDLDEVFPAKPDNTAARATPEDVARVGLDLMATLNDAAPSAARILTKAKQTLS